MRRPRQPCSPSAFDRPARRSQAGTPSLPPSERWPGIAPGSSRWRPEILLLNYHREKEPPEGVAPSIASLPSEVPRCLGLDGKKSSDEIRGDGFVCSTH